MSKTKLLGLKNAINRNINAVMPLEEEKNSFLHYINLFISSLYANKNADEEFQKNLFRDFLRNIIPDRFINTSSKIDLAIYNGDTSKSSVGVIVEYKSLTNNNEMMRTDNLNSKAFQELIAYYLKERLINNNIEVKRCIVTNGHSFFVINSNELDKHFKNNKKLVNNFNKFEKRQLSSDSTSFLYSEIIAPAVDKAIQKGIKIVHFDLNDYLLTNKIEVNKSKITQLFRFFSKENLLNDDVLTDSNKLNKGFYDELLYIMGLYEKKESNKHVIDRLPEKKRQPASFVENTIEQLDIKGTDGKSQFEIAVQLTVLWINRILFLKLLESTLVSFHDSGEYYFLNYAKCHSFNDISDLFFAVMAKRPEDRISRLKAKFPYIPYMNSSLFESSELEKAEIGINTLREGNIQIYSKTKLKGTNGKKLTGEIPVIKYLFKFLNSYDFTSTGTVHESNKNQLINASVLGLIFEKINGYKDGSFFTPGKITMYMAKQAMRQAITTKINEEMNWHYKSIIELGYQLNDYSNVSIEERRRISKTIDSIKVLDPAVGSGHFLVSILNEVIAIKSSLRVLFDADGNLLNDVQCTVVNDELVIQDFTGKNFAYKVNNFKTERIQKAIFEQKQKIIENCLYGVDINPNSVNICRLRLWIELLKSAYYSKNKEGDVSLTTLPNIDVNVKIGDSLVHQFQLNSNFDLKKKDFREYLELVKDYKNTSNKRLKADINQHINKIKGNFYATFVTPEGKKLNKIRKQRNAVGQMDLFRNLDSKEFERLNNLVQKADIAFRSFQHQAKDPLYQKSMEWRIEFPEVLNKEGNFVGFDVVIANPPYVFARNQSFDKQTKDYYSAEYQVAEYQANTYTLFMELGYNLLKPNGTFAFLVPNNILTIQSDRKIRNFLQSKTGSLIIINSLDKLFADANVDNCLVFFKKEQPNNITVGELYKGDYQKIGDVPSNFFGQNEIFSISMVKYRNAVSAFKQIDSFSATNNKEGERTAIFKSGVEAYEVGKGTPKMTKEQKDNRIYHSKVKVDQNYLPYIDGENVSRYKLSWNGEYIKYGKNLAAMRDPDLFDGPRILVRQIPTKSNYSIEAVFTDTHIINDRNSMIISHIKGINPLSFLAVINSKPLTLWFLIKFDKFQRRIFPQLKVNELEKFPIPPLTAQWESQLIELATSIMKMRGKSQDFSKENLLIDEIVMDAFGLNNEQKETIRDFKF